MKRPLEPGSLASIDSWASFLGRGPQSIVSMAELTGHGRRTAELLRVTLHKVFVVLTLPSLCGITRERCVCVCVCLAVEMNQGSTLCHLT